MKKKKKRRAACASSFGYKNKVNMYKEFMQRKINVQQEQQQQQQLNSMVGETDQLWRIHNPYAGRERGRESLAFQISAK